MSLDAFRNWSKALQEPEYRMDTTLRLDSPGSSSLFNSKLKASKRKWADADRIEVSGCTSLALGLGCSLSSSDSSKRSSETACSVSSVKETEEESSVHLGLNFQLHIGHNSIPSSNQPTIDGCPKVLETSSAFDLQLSLSTGPSKSILTCLTPVSGQHQDSTNAQEVNSQQPFLDGSTSAHRRFKIHYVDQHTTETNNNCSAGFDVPSVINSVPAAQHLSSTIAQTLQCPVTSSSGIIHRQRRNINSKGCQFSGCSKGARGASGFCIAHGGGRRCQKEGCHKGAEGRTIYCKAHGGGRRCEHLGCTKSAEGRTDFCIAHGGGRRCCHAACSRAARGRSGLCIRHGGGKRCQKENCTKSAEGYSGLCISHGGGRRCQYPECTKGAQGSTMFCKAHGGGKRCTFHGCTKGAEGSTPFCKGHGGGKRCSFHGGGICPKSVHGGTLFCVAHGGGKRCAVPECTKSARGRTDFCVRHGGGKRCKSEGCGKSAQGSTDFCKAHGGGKRCAWGYPGSGFGAGHPVCDRFARGKTGLCAAHSAVVQDNRVHGGIVSTLTDLNPACNNLLKMKDVAVEESSPKINYGGQGAFLWNTSEQGFLQPTSSSPDSMLCLPEGRVHGGSLIAMVTNAGPMNRSRQLFEGATSEKQFLSFNSARNWI